MTRDEAIAQMRRASPWRTICEVHREIYEACGVLEEADRNKLRELVLEAFVMGKKMEGRLREYKADWDAGWWGKNEDHRSDSERRQ